MIRLFRSNLSMTRNSSRTSKLGLATISIKDARIAPAGKTALILITALVAILVVACGLAPVSILIVILSRALMYL